MATNFFTPAATDFDERVAIMRCRKKICLDGLDGPMQPTRAAR